MLLITGKNLSRSENVREPRASFFQVIFESVTYWT